MQMRIMQVREDSPYRDAVERLNDEAFCMQERSTFDLFMVGCKTGMADLLAFLDGEKFVGFAYIVTWRRMLYLYYLAIDPGSRGKGYGSAALDTLKDRYSPDSITLNMEFPDGSEEKERRLKFYVLNGFMENRVKEKWHGMDFELMYWGKTPDQKEIGMFFGEFEKARRDIVAGYGTEHSMGLRKGPFDSIVSGRKTVEMRLYDEKRRKILPGDRIRFSDGEGEETVVVVKDVIRFPSFKELYETFDKKDLGYGDGEDASPVDMEKYYSVEDIERYGVLAIRIGKPS